MQKIILLFQYLLMNKTNPNQVLLFLGGALFILCGAGVFISLQLPTTFGGTSLTETDCLILLPPFQNVGRFGFSRFIVFAMHLNITYVQIHNKIYESRKVKTTYILERREYDVELLQLIYYMISHWWKNPADTHASA